MSRMHAFFASLLVAGPWLALPAGPAMALACRNVETGEIRQSETPSCFLGERQVLPEPESRPAAPAAGLLCVDPATGGARESDNGSCRLGERQLLPQGPGPGRPPAPTVAAEGQPDCLPPTPATAQAEQAVRAGFGHGVVFASGRIIVAGPGGDALGAELRLLSPDVAMEKTGEGAGGSRSRLTLRCAKGDCWRPEGGTAQGSAGAPASAATFLIEGHGEQAASGLASLITACGRRN